MVLTDQKLSTDLLIRDAGMLPEIPSAYLEYIRVHGPFEGFTSDEAEPGYVELWMPETIPSNNRDIQIEVLAPGFLAFAGNGGGEVLAFDRAGAIYMLPMIGMTPDCAIPVARDFQSFTKIFVR